MIDKPTIATFNKQYSVVTRHVYICRAVQHILIDKIYYISKFGNTLNRPKWVATQDICQNAY